MPIIGECIETEYEISSEKEFYLGKYYPGNGLLFDDEAYLSKEVVERIPKQARRSTECNLSEEGVEIWIPKVVGHSRRLWQAHEFMFSISGEDGEKYLPKLVKSFKDDLGKDLKRRKK